MLKDETIWLTINQMAGLFGIDKSGISRHIKNVFKTGELDNEKLKNPDNPFGKDYFDELLEEIRDIRSSEKRFLQNSAE